MTPAAAGSLRGWGAGARAAGAVFTLGYLLGFVRGPVLAVAGGLALVTLGRAAGARDSDDLVLGGALAALAAALLVGGLRWETLDLAGLRGAQAVLGPGLLVGPPATAAASWLATGAATAALAAWLAAARRADEGLPAPDGALPRALWMGEGILGSLAVVTVFWGPSVPRGALVGGEAALALLEGIAAVAAVAAVAVAGATWLARFPEWRAWTVASAGAGVVGAAAVMTAAIS